MYKRQETLLKTFYFSFPPISISSGPNVLASLSFSISIGELGRPTLLAVEVSWWRSLAERLPRGMDEAVGRGSSSAQRAQQLPDLH